MIERLQGTLSDCSLDQWQITARKVNTKGVLYRHQIS